MKKKDERCEYVRRNASFSGSHDGSKKSFYIDNKNEVFGVGKFRDGGCLLWPLGPLGQERSLSLTKTLIKIEGNKLVMYEKMFGLVKKIDLGVLIIRQ